MKVKQLIISIILFILGVFFKFSTLIGSFPSWIESLGIPVMVGGIFLFIYSFKWKTRHEKLIESTFPHIEDNEKIKLLFYTGLESYRFKIIHLFYKENGRERIIIFMRDDNNISYEREYLHLVDEDEIMWCNCYGFWESTTMGISLFQDEALLLNELERELSEYAEIEIPNELKNQV